MINTTLQDENTMSIKPEGEHIRKAIKWISAERISNPQCGLLLLIEAACVKFDLSPKDETFLIRFLKENKHG